MFGQNGVDKMDENSKSNPMFFETTTITFFVILLICIICILLLLAIFFYKCFTGKTTEEPAKPPCTDENEGEDCLFASAKMNKPKDQEKVLLRLVNMDMPVRPGILVQRQSKDGEVASPLGEITEAEEDKHRQTLEPLTNAGETTLEGESAEKTPVHVHRTSTAESQKRPLKGVTFSKEVIVVDLGNKYPTPRSYSREHKERK
ncbi:uncharacterized protein C2orf74 homolog [Cricetulus griseus]|uniref:RIKEN cDNA 1700093K21 gene n=1 Tax=Cricetulus griseus TaxID=10029 RepID=A0A061ILV0_CRIGR|nr:uncharacterized protein C2orf74 homolog [Cricetulus griseus]XP_027243536.1 uncharacterized protein C2orf74 homolog [Cricetulus griseus]ERE88211.1 hypothetical protein H671_1g3230 [Cricetulus griseus]